MCTCHEVALKPATGLCPSQLCHIIVCVFCCVTFYPVVLNSKLGLNNGIATLTSNLKYLTNLIFSFHTVSCRSLFFPFDLCPVHFALCTWAINQRGENPDL